MSLDWGLFETSIGPRVRLLRNALQAGSIAASEPFGLPTGSLTVMVLVAANLGSSQAEMAAMAGITRPGLVGLLDELEKRGLLVRLRDAADRRRNMLALTDDGLRTMDRLFATVAPIEAPIRAKLGETGLAELTRLLDRAIAALEQ